MRIEKHISDLLYRYSCVMVPGFGGFLAEIHSAYFDEKLGVFYPPQKRIRFSSQLKSNDGLLANELVANEGISYEIALKAIENEVFSWQNTLEKDQVLVLENIGNFYQDIDKNVSFEPVTSINYLSTSFGMQPLYSPKIKRDVAFEISKNKTNLLVEEPKTQRFGFVKYAAIFLISVSSVVAIYNTYTNLYTNTTEAINEASFFTIATEATKTTLKFHIVAGVFKNLENAEVEQKNLVNKGFEATIVTRATGSYTVLYKSFPTYTEAKYNLTEIKNNQNPEAWLLIEDL